jgi:hypothetical protein
MHHPTKKPAVRHKYLEQRASAGNFHRNQSIIRIKRHLPSWLSKNYPLLPFVTKWWINDLMNRRNTAASLIKLKKAGNGRRQVGNKHNSPMFYLKG